MKGLIRGNPMDNRLSKEVLKAHNASDKPAEPAPIDQVSNVTRKTPFRERTGTMQSDTGSTASGAGKMKLFRLRHKIKLFGGSFSKSGSETHVQKQYENTYRLEPKDPSEKFPCKKAEDIIRSVLEGYLKDKDYDPKKFPTLCKSLAELIKERVKSTGVQRYKLIAHVMILENQGQSMRHVSRCLWNKDLDNYATSTFETKQFVAVGSVFGAYYDWFLFSYTVI